MLLAKNIMAMNANMSKLCKILLVCFFRTLLHFCIRTPTAERWEKIQWK